MYSVILAAMLTTGNEVPDFGRRGGCHGCYGGCYGGCWGGGYGGCWGGGYGGCWGGGGGGCWGGGYGGCFGCGGGCFGCGGCGGMAVMQGGGCIGAQQGGGGGGGGGGSGSQGGGGSQTGGSSASVTQSLQDMKKSIEDLQSAQNKLRLESLKIIAEGLKQRETDQKIDELRRTVEEMRKRLPPPPGGPPVKVRPELPPPQPGKVLLQMPADALIVINDRRIESDSAFETPPLEEGSQYVVNVEVVVIRDGKSVNRVKQLSIRGGEVVRLSYKDMESANGRWTKKAEQTAQITVQLPADARLNVHGIDCPLTSDSRTFETPALTPGQTYYYNLKAEVVRDGRVIAQTRRVGFRSGERVLVSFEDLGANLLTAR
jgi:uncharacterized protein (TIGR03000 family)